MEENNSLVLEEIVQDFIEKIKFNDNFREEYLKTINKSFLNWDFVIEIPPDVENERRENFIRSELYENKELNQIYYIKLNVLNTFLNNNQDYKKVHLELIRLDPNNDFGLNNYNFERLLFAFYTDVKPNEKFILIDTDTPILISDIKTGIVKNNIFKKELKNILDKYVKDKTERSNTPKIDNTKIITLSKSDDIVPVTSLTYKPNEDDYLIELKPAIIMDSFKERVYYRRTEYDYQYTLIMKGVVMDKVSSKLTNPFDTFCLNPPDNC